MQIANGDTGASARGMINAFLPDQVAFTAAVPLNGTKVLAPQTVSAVIAFTVGATALFGTCYVRLLANGANAPTFTGMIEHGSSSGYNNTNGVLNLINFWFDGVTTYYSVAQGLNVSPTPIPTVSFAADVTQNEGNSGTTAMTYTVNRSSSVGATSVPWTFSAGTTDATDYAGGILPSGGNVTMADGVSSGTFTISINGDTTNEATETYTVSITAPTGYVLGSKSSATGTVVNDDGVGTAYMRFTNRAANLAESVNGSGYDYTATGSPSNYNTNKANGYSSTRLPASTDGFIAASIVTFGTTGPMIGLSTTVAPTGFQDGMVMVMFADSAAGANWSIRANNSGVPTGSQTNVAPVMAGDTARIRRAGTNMLAEVSRDNGTTWITIYTLAAASTAALTAYIETANTAASSRIVQPYTSGNFA